MVIVAAVAVAAAATEAPATVEVAVALEPAVVAALAVVVHASHRTSTLAVAEHIKGPENLKCHLPGFKTCR